MSSIAEDTSSLPVGLPETNFNGTEGDRLGQLVVTPEVVVSKINNLKDYNSPARSRWDSTCNTRRNCGTN